MSKSQGRNGQEVKSEKSKATDGCGMEGGDFAEVRGFGRVVGVEEGHLEDCDGFGETRWHRG